MAGKRLRGPRRTDPDRRPGPQSVPAPAHVDRRRRTGARAATQVEYSSALADLLDCHVLFVDSSERRQTGTILSTVAGRPILTVGEVPDFARQGGIINFYLEGQKVRFEINRAAAERNELRLAARMLRLARLVGPEPEETR